MSFRSAQASPTAATRSSCFVPLESHPQQQRLRACPRCRARPFLSVVVLASSTTSVCGIACGVTPCPRPVPLRRGSSCRRASRPRQLPAATCVSALRAHQGSRALRLASGAPPVHERLRDSGVPVPCACHAGATSHRVCKSNRPLFHRAPANRPLIHRAPATVVEDPPATNAAHGTRTRSFGRPVRHALQARPPVLKMSPCEARMCEGVISETPGMTLS